MAARRRRKSRSLAAQAFELGVAAPLVVAHRMARMAMAGSTPSPRDRAEFRRMGTEKIAAAGEAWSAMATQAMRENQKFAIRFMQSLWLVRPNPSAKSISRQVNQATARVLGKGMAPVRRRAVANAKRLSGGGPRR